MAIAQEVLQNQDKDGMLRRALERIIQLYTDKSHFVYELLQNAEDAGASKIKFLQYEDRLEVLHDGHPFSTANLQGLCDIGKSDKINDLNQIGEFGVGFKSVFGICEKVQLFSQPGVNDLKEGYKQFSTEIIDFTHPVDIEDQEVSTGYTTKFIFPYSVGYPFSGFESISKLNEVLSKRLQNLGITTLLFMKNLQSIDYTIDLPKLKTRGSYILDKDQINDHCALVSALGESGKNKEEDISYLVFTRPVSGIQAGRTIDIAFTVSIDEKGEYIFQASKHPYISVYFPTETESKLRFIVQGPYRTTPNRSSVPADDKDNVELARQTAVLLRDSVIELRNAGRLNYSLLNVLPIDEGVIYSAPLFEGMFKTTKDMMLEEALLLCKDGQYASADCVKIARGDKFAEIMREDLLTELLDDGTEYHWLPTFLTETNKQYKELYSFLTDVLDIEVMRPENLRNCFNANREFLKNRDDEWLAELYNMYTSVAAAFSKQRGGSNMLTAEFIKSSKGFFLAPYRKSDANSMNGYDYLFRGYESSSYLPNIFLPSKSTQDMDDIHYVNQDLFEKCKEFFTDILGLQKPNEYEFFIRDFKKRYDKIQQFTEDQHISDVKKILHYRTNADYREEVDGLISKYLVLRCIKGENKIYVNPHKEKVFFSVTASGMSIEQYYKNIQEFSYVDIDFYAIDDVGYDSLKLMGVLDSIAVGENKTNGEYYTGNPGRQPEWNTYQDFRWKLSLDKLDFVLEYIEKHPKAADSMAKSSFIFRFLQINESRLVGTVYVGGSCPNLNNAHSDIVTKIRRDGNNYRYYGSTWTGKWVYTESGELVSHSEVSKREINSALYGDVKYNSQLYEILGFKKNAADQLEDAAKDYDRLTDEEKNQYFAIELQRRFGISIAALEDSFGGNQFSGESCVTEDTYEFPSSNIKNWDSLRKHAAEILCFASPVKYEYAVRRLRISKPSNEVRAYLMSMYRVDGIYKYACQMCHEPFTNVEMCQIANEPEVELDPMNLCLCPNCAAEYKKMRSDYYNVKCFLDDITSKTEREINSEDPVKIDFNNESIWFTQTHIAEIRELIALREEAEIVQKKPDMNSPKTDMNATDEESENVVSGTDVYKDYIGRRVLHKGKKEYAFAKSCDGRYLGLEFDNTPGKITNYSLEMCLKNDWIQVVE